MTQAAEPFFTRREGDALSRRVEDIDQHGSRGMQLLGSQTQGNTEALGRLQQEVHERFAEHTRQHLSETTARVKARRWRITAFIGAVAALATVMGLLVAILSRIHG